MRATINITDAASQVWDHIIVGAGVAGCFLAGLLAGEGRKVLVVEKATLPRRKTCGACLNPRAVAILEAHGFTDLLDQGTLLKGTSFRSPKGEEFYIPFPENHGRAVALSRWALDEALARWAISRNAAYLDGCRVVDSKVDSNLRKITVMDGIDSYTLQSRHVAACDGLGSQIAKGESLGTEVFALGVPKKFGCSWELPKEAVHGLDPQSITLLLHRDGYLGLTVVEAGKWNLAAAIVKKKENTPLSFLRRVLRDHKVSVDENILEAAKPLTCPVLHRGSKSPACEKLFLVGDSAGYFEPITGEGMAWALESALLAAETINKFPKDQWQDIYTKRWSEGIAKHTSLMRKAAFAGTRPGLVTLANSLTNRLPSLHERLIDQLTSPLERRLGS